MYGQPAALRTPAEVWLYILKEAVSRESPETVFFPLLDDFSLISGFSMACKSFHLIAMGFMLSAFFKSICVINIGTYFDAMQEKGLDSGRIRHLSIKRKATLEDFQIYIPRFKNLLSLSVSLSSSIFGEKPQRRTLYAPRHLVRLDLTYAHAFTCPPTLEFFSLEELRLASKNPLVKRDKAEYVPYHSPGFESKLRFALYELQRLKRLSVHVSLDDPDRIGNIQSKHFDRHRRATVPPGSFTQCETCRRNYPNDHVLKREAFVSLSLAQFLQNLESVFWMNAWNDSFYDEEGMRESTIIRRDDGKVSVKIDGMILASRWG